MNFSGEDDEEAPKKTSKQFKKDPKKKNRAAQEQSVKMPVTVTITPKGSTSIGAEDDFEVL
jgi:hypothetical protein